MSPSVATSIAPSIVPPLASPTLPPLTPALEPSTVAPAPKGVDSPNATWTAARIEELRACLDRGMTCSQIAAAIGVSRNAVIGKIHRLGLSSGRPAGAPTRANCPPRARHPRGPTQRRLLRLAYAHAPVDEIMSSMVVISTHPCSLIDIGAHQCRWPIGDPARTDFLFCGNDAIGGFAYCLGHARMAYRTPARR